MTADTDGLDIPDFLRRDQRFERKVAQVAMNPASIIYPVRDDPLPPLHVQETAKTRERNREIEIINDR